MGSKGIQVAIDGPASAGKSTVAKKIANRFQYIYCDTGAMYRTVTLKAMQQGVALDDPEALAEMLKHTAITFKPGDPEQLVFLDGNDVTAAIRQEDVTNNVSTTAAQGTVRADLTNRQREIADAGGIVMDGRDIGTTVLPDAQVKIFLVASVEERAQRRFKDNAEKGIHTPIDVLRHEIEVRDHKDSTRAISPLTQAADAVKLDTTSLSIDDVVDKISAIIDQNTEKSN
ncbi:cytidylate kinase [Secundilactobacillus paracollinoides]|uniref:Cytidylate kinase n=1 Tax=Secundilactobacillus paracollinoides TaxID=240427 RepID=A0A1B2J102_9LACO|nr:(d)CMP kinase [Secundilactobacillus paracollinoides]ANZ61984.1 cytidylate kinase [Secundilactobacillus paracollinoides]ANZ63671.1 cytidylate kinase [Secundilactobacillus paracollinoides]ANZ67930.1 cytidylate kinase [Secundilactobacillus paracollinoides]